MELNLTVVATHPVNGLHFGAFYGTMQEIDPKVKVLAAENAYLELKKIPDVCIEDINPSFRKEDSLTHLDKMMAERRSNYVNLTVDKCCRASHVLIEVGSLFAAEVIEGLSKRDVKPCIVAYYDNPEAHVPGGYSEHALRVMRLADQVLFANKNLAKEPLYSDKGQEIVINASKKVGLGYFPFDQVDSLKALRQSTAHQETIKTKLGIAPGEKALVYIGGANKAYYENGWPHFLKVLEDFNPTGYKIIFQRHPRADNSDLDALELWLEKHPAFKDKFIVSKENTHSVVAIADQVFYHQTTMSNVVALAGVPVYQVSETPYEDVLIKTSKPLCIQMPTEFLSVMQGKGASCDLAQLIEILGADPSWKDQLRKIFN